MPAHVIQIPFPHTEEFLDRIFYRRFEYVRMPKLYRVDARNADRLLLRDTNEKETGWPDSCFPHPFQKYIVWAGQRVHGRDREYEEMVGGDTSPIAGILRACSSGTSKDVLFALQSTTSSRTACIIRTITAVPPKGFLQRWFGASEVTISMVLDGLETRLHSQVAEQMTFSADGRRFACVDVDSKSRVLVDGVENDVRFDEIWGLYFNSTSSSYFYVGVNRLFWRDYEYYPCLNGMSVALPCQAVLAILEVEFSGPDQVDLVVINHSGFSKVWATKLRVMAKPTEENLWEKIVRRPESRRTEDELEADPP